MIEKNNENSSKSDSFKPLEEDEIRIRNFKLLYRNATNQERDKSSAVSSDEETTSSSLVPIPESLKQLRKSKWTVSDPGDHSEAETYMCGDFVKSTGNIMTSLEELRKKYTLKNESSVNLKMNSVNLMLDDILNSTYVSEPSTDLHQQNFKKEEFRQKTDSESVISTTETSVSHIQPCAHVIDHSPLPVALEYYPSPCPRHCGAVQRLHTSEEKGPPSPKKGLEGNQRKKSFSEKFQNLQLKDRIWSIYRNWQKTKNPLSKTHKDSENNVVQGIPSVGDQGGAITAYKSQTCKCEYSKHFPKTVFVDLVEPSEISQSDNSSEREKHHCTCMNQRNCTCPEVIPSCICVQQFQATIHNLRPNSAHSQAPSTHNESMQESQSALSAPKNIESEASLTQEKGNGDKKIRKTEPEVKCFKGDTQYAPITPHDSIHKNHKFLFLSPGWKHCTKERNVIERTDIYYFDHGNSAYYQTTDNHPMRYTECLVERTDEYATKFWAEFFGTIEIGIAFLISFILQLYRFLFTSLIRSLTVGLLQIFSDYFFKPLLTIIFNGIIQPCLILAYNIATSVRDLCRPISEIFGFFAQEVANMLKSFRLVDVKCDKQYSCHCENKV